MFRSCMTISKLKRQTSGSLKNYVNQLRTYKDIPFKPPTMAELPVPSGSWASNYAKNNAKYNMILLLGTSILGATVTYFVNLDFIKVISGPGKIPIESGISSAEKEEDASSETTNASEPVEEKTSVPKSEQEFHVVVVKGKVDEPSANVELFSSTKSSKDIVVIVESNTDINTSSVINHEMSVISSESEPSTNFETDSSASPESASK